MITDDYQTSNHYYNFNSSNKTAVINSVKGSTHDVGLVTVPSFVKNAGVTYTVVGIGSFAYSDAPGMTGVIIPDSIKSIGDYAFHNSSIQTVDFGKGVESIDDSAFQGTKLTSVKVPDSVKTMVVKRLLTFPAIKMVLYPLVKIQHMCPITGPLLLDIPFQIVAWCPINH